MRVENESHVANIRLLDQSIHGAVLSPWKLRIRSVWNSTVRLWHAQRSHLVAKAHSFFHWCRQSKLGSKACRHSELIQAGGLSDLGARTLWPCMTLEMTPPTAFGAPSTVLCRRQLECAAPWSVGVPERAWEELPFRANSTEANSPALVS